MRPHTFMPDSSATDRPGGKPRCGACGLLPESNRAHDVPEVTDEQRALDARRIGEAE